LTLQYDFVRFCCLNNISEEIVDGRGFELTFRGGGGNFYSRWSFLLQQVQLTVNDLSRISMTCGCLAGLLKFEGWHFPDRKAPVSTGIPQPDDDVQSILQSPV
jgi:hypothetical protein